MAANNPSNLLDIGVVGHFVTDHYQHTGLIRDHLDGKWKFFSNVSTEPTTTINFAEANTIYDTVKVGTIEAATANIGGTNLAVFANQAFTQANVAVAGVAYTAGVDLSQNTNITNANTLAQTATSLVVTAGANTVYLQSALNVANVNIAYILTVDQLQNTGIGLANTLAQTATSLAQTAGANTVYTFGVDLAQNTGIGLANTLAQTATSLAQTAGANTVYLQGALNSANANITYLFGVINTNNTAINTAASNTVYTFGVDDYQNTAIGNANTLAQTAYALASTSSANDVYIFGVQTTQNNNINLVGNTANSALPNIGTVITVNNLSTLVIANSKPSTSNITGALVVSGGVGVTGNVYADVVYAGNTITQGLVASGVASFNNNLNIGGTLTQGNFFSIGGVTSFNYTGQIMNGALQSGLTKTLNIGGNGLAGSNTVITIGPSTTGNGIVRFGDVTPVNIANTLFVNQMGTFNSGLTAFGTIALNSGSGGGSPLTIGGTNATGNIILGQSAATQNISIGSGGVTSGNIQSIYIGTNAQSGATNQIFIGTSGLATSTINMNGTLNLNSFGQNLTLGSTSGSLLLATGQTTGPITLGGGAAGQSGLGLITLGQSQLTQTLNIQSGNTQASNTKTINIGLGGQPGSNTIINIGSSGSNGAVNFGNTTLVTITNTTSSISNTTGALVVSGGIGIQGNVYANAVYLQGFGITFADGTTQTTSGGTASSNTIYIQGGLNTANANIAYILSVDQLQNTNIGLANTLAQTATSLAQTAGANTVYLQSALNSANANITYLFGVINTDNTAINTVAANTVYLTGGLNSANANLTYLFGVQTTQNNNITLAGLTANNALPNTGSIITVNGTSTLIIANTTQTTSNSTGALVVKGGAAVTGNLFTGNITIIAANSGVITTNAGELVLSSTGDLYGPITLRLQNRTGMNGALFDASGSTVPLVDFAFKTSANTRNIRYETRSIYSALPYQASYTSEFQFFTPATSTPNFIISDYQAYALGNTASSNTTTGSFIVKGGVGVTGNVYADRIYTTGLFYSANGNPIQTGGGGTFWISKTSNYTAQAFENIIADTSAGPFTITLPSSPVTGVIIQLTDGADWSANTLTVARNGSTIENINDDLLVTLKGITVQLIYSGTTWQVTATTGARGPTGNTGNTGSFVTTYETIAKNLSGYPYTMNYSANVLISTVYTTPSSSTITKSFNYSSGILSSIVITGDSLSNTYTKIFTYTNGLISSVGYTVT